MGKNKAVYRSITGNQYFEKTEIKDLQSENALYRLLRQEAKKRQNSFNEMQKWTQKLERKTNKNGKNQYKRFNDTIFKNKGKNETKISALLFPRKLAQ